jgi:adenosine deaminase
MKLPSLYSDQLRALPKVDLHRHLDCSMRWSTMVELAPLVGLELPTNYYAQREYLLVTDPMKDLGAVLNKFLRAQKILNSVEILTRLAYEACEDAFNDGVRILELRYAPTFILDGHEHLTFDKIHAAFLRGIETAQKKFPMAVGLLCIVQRVKSEREAERVCDFTVANKDTFLGLDLADNEDGFEPKKFARFFRRAFDAGLRLTVHSGEANAPAAAQWVKDSIEILGAERIGHGVQIIRDESVLQFVRDRKIPLEVCPISNWLTQAFRRHEDHPVRKLMQAGVLITINSDDPGIFGTQLSDDYEVLHRVHGFNHVDFESVNDVAAAVSFIAKAEKQKFWPREIRDV